MVEVTIKLTGEHLNIDELIKAVSLSQGKGVSTKEEQKIEISKEDCNSKEEQKIEVTKEEQDADVENLENVKKIAKSSFIKLAKLNKDDAKKLLELFDVSKFSELDEELGDDINKWNSVVEIIEKTNECLGG